MVLSTNFKTFIYYRFCNIKNENVIIWDADTIIIKKINFLIKKSVKYGNTSYFHKAYYHTNKTILKELPKYYISSLSQFVNLSTQEQNF